MGMYNDTKLVETGIGGFEKSRTKQAFREESDINNIIAKYEKTGQVTYFNEKEPFYGDVSDIKDYQEAVNVVEKAEELFMGMSANIREKFSNDPVKMIEFLSDPKNMQEAIDLGMVDKPTVIKPKEVTPEGGAAPAAK